MKNEIRFTLESKQRPKLAQEIGNILGTAPHYEREEKPFHALQKVLKPLIYKGFSNPIFSTFS